MIVFAGLGASLAPAASARAQCTAARVVGRTETLSETWRAAVDELVRSTAEPAHPWSCGGGTVALDLAADGGRLTVAREGAEPVTRPVASPNDVLPIGQALLSTQLSHAHREVVLLVDLGGLSGVEAAEALGIPAGTVWRRLHEARARLRLKLQRRAP